MNQEEQEELDDNLIDACEAGDLKKVIEFFNRGANIHDGTPLVLASLLGYLDIVKFLVKNGVDIHYDNELAITSASLEGHLEVIKYLTEKGANIHAQNNKALINASQNGHLEVVKYFVIEHFCSIEIVIKNAKKNKKDEVFTWCKNYLNNKNLNDKLEINLSKNIDTKNSKKMKV